MLYPDRGAVSPDLEGFQFSLTTAALSWYCQQVMPVRLCQLLLLKMVPGLEMSCKTCAWAQLLVIHLHQPEYLRLVGGSGKGCYGLVSQ